MEETILTIKVRESTRQQLRQIHAETGESIIEIVERLATGELEKLNRSKGMQSKFDVYKTHLVGDKISHTRLSTVEANDANGARRYVCDTQWQDLGSLVAFPQGEKPQRFTTDRQASTPN